MTTSTRCSVRSGWRSPSSKWCAVGSRPPTTGVTTPRCRSVPRSARTACSRNGSAPAKRCVPCCSSYQDLALLAEELGQPPCRLNFATLDRMIVSAMEWQDLEPPRVMRHVPRPTPADRRKTLPFCGAIMASMSDHLNQITLNGERHAVAPETDRRRAAGKPRPRPRRVRGRSESPGRAQAPTRRASPRRR